MKSLIQLNFFEQTHAGKEEIFNIKPSKINLNLPIMFIFLKGNREKLKLKKKQLVNLSKVAHRVVIPIRILSAARSIMLIVSSWCFFPLQRTLWSTLN